MEKLKNSNKNKLSNVHHISNAVVRTLNKNLPISLSLVGNQNKAEEYVKCHLRVKLSNQHTEDPR